QSCQEGFDCGLQVTLVLQGQGQVVMSIRIIGLQAQSFLVSLDGLLPLLVLRESYSLVPIQLSLSLSSKARKPGSWWQNWDEEEREKSENSCEGRRKDSSRL